MSREKCRWKIEQRFVGWLVVGGWWWFSFGNSVQSSHCRVPKNDDACWGGLRGEGTKPSSPRHAQFLLCASCEREKRKKETEGKREREKREKERKTGTI